MNKTQKILIATCTVMAAGFIALSVYASRASTMFNWTLVTVTNNTSVSTFPTNTLTTNINGVASQYLGWPTNVATNSVQLLPTDDKYQFIRVVNNGAFAITVSPINPVIASNGFVVTAGGGSLTLPLSSGGGTPWTLYAAPTNAGVAAITNVYSEGWLNVLGN